MKQETIMLNEGGKYPLKGLLTLPEGDGPFPGVVLVHGSGSSNMDEKVGKLTPFRDLAEGLADRGIATVLYEDLNHCFVPAISDQISKAKKEYNMERHIGPEVIDQIARWIYANNG